MGIYIYSLRAKTVSITVPGAGKVKANLYSYSYKHYSMWKGDYGYNSYQLTAENAKRNAENAFAAPRSGFVVMGDLSRGLEGDAVYRDVTAAQYWDTDKFPGTLIGWLRKVGKGYTVADRTEWSKGTKALRGETWVPIRTRMIMIDGKPTYQSEDIEPEAQLGA
jgi:hypothetical protein